MYAGVLEQEKERDRAQVPESKLKLGAFPLIWQRGRRDVSLNGKRPPADGWPAHCFILIPGTRRAREYSGFRTFTPQMTVHLF